MATIDIVTPAELKALKDAAEAADVALRAADVQFNAKDTALSARLDLIASQVAALSTGQPPTVPTDPATPPATGPANIPGIVLLDSFAGSTDDAKFDAAVAYAKAQTFKPYIGYGNRKTTLTKGFNVYSGFRFGPAFPTPVEQVRGGNPYAGYVKINVPGTWLNFAGEVHGTTLAGVYEGTPSTSFARTPNGGGVVWTAAWHDLGFTNFKNILGTETEKFLYTMSSFFEGHCNINNSYGMAIHVGGSDGSFFSGARSCLDSPTRAPFGPASQIYHMWFEGASKTSVGDVYCTAEGNWGGLKVTGGTSSWGLNFHGLVLEGRNAGAPCNAPLITHEGGEASYQQVTTNYGKGAEIIRVSGGTASFDNCGYAKANGIAETVPFINRVGGEVRVRSARRFAAWTGKPLVKGQANVDDSVAVG